MHRRLLPAVALAAALSPQQGAAYTATGTILVSVTVPKACTIAAGALAFGNYTGTKVDAATTLTVTCTTTTAYQVGADNGVNAQYIGVWAKYMTGPSGSRLRYHVYTDAARSIEWGSTAGSNEVAGTGTGAAQTIPVYGTIGAGSYGSLAGTYTDTITFTLYY